VFVSFKILANDNMTVSSYLSIVIIWQLANLIDGKIKTKTPFGIHPKGVFYILFNK